MIRLFIHFLMKKLNRLLGWKIWKQGEVPEVWLSEEDRKRYLEYRKKYLRNRKNIRRGKNDL